MFERGFIQEFAAVDDVVVDFASFAGLILLLGKDLFRDVRWLVAGGQT